MFKVQEKGKPKQMTLLKSEFSLEVFNVKGFAQIKFLDRFQFEGWEKMRDRFQMGPL